MYLTNKRLLAYGQMQSDMISAFVEGYFWWDIFKTIINSHRLIFVLDVVKLIYRYIFNYLIQTKTWHLQQHGHDTSAFIHYNLRKSNRKFFLYSNNCNNISIEPNILGYFEGSLIQWYRFSWIFKISLVRRYLNSWILIGSFVLNGNETFHLEFEFEV